LEDARKKASNALIYGIVGLFVFGIIMGIIAITQGSAAKKSLMQFNEPYGNATGAMILGVVDIIGGIVSTIMGFLYMSALFGFLF
jgi:hypothetical protein